MQRIVGSKGRSPTGPSLIRSGKGNFMTQENNNNILNKPVGQTSGSNSGASATQRQKQSLQGGDFAAQTGKGLLEQVKSTAGSAYDSATHTATSKIDDQKVNLSIGLSSVADSVRRIGEGLQGGNEPVEGVAKVTAEYSDTVAKKLDQAANYFENKDLKQMYSDAESFARRNPAVLIGGAFVLGILAVRFLKSSNSGSTMISKNSTGFNNENRKRQVNGIAR